MWRSSRRRWRVMPSAPVRCCPSTSRAPPAPATRRFSALMCRPARRDAPGRSGKAPYPALSVSEMRAVLPEGTFFRVSLTLNPGYGAPLAGRPVRSVQGTKQPDIANERTVQAPKWNVSRETDCGKLEAPSRCSHGEGHVQHPALELMDV